MINWGIIGLGNIATTFAKDLKLVPDAKLEAVASRNIEKAINFKDAHNAKKAYGNYETLAKDPEIDIVYIATPHVFHFDNAKLCLEQGKAVLCEKPMGMNANQVKKLCAIAKSNNVLLMEAMWTAFLPNFQYLQEIVASKKLGNITKFKADFCFKAPNSPSHRLINKSLGGGTVLDIGIYTVFSCLELLGIPKSIDATAEISTTGIDLSCNTIFRYNDFDAELESSFKKDSLTQIEIEFEDGTIILGPNFYAPSSLIIKSASKTETRSKYPKGTGYQLEAIHFQNLYKNNQLESPILPHKKSIQLSTYLDSILKSIGVSYN